MPKAKKEAASTQDEVRRDPSLRTHKETVCSLISFSAHCTSPHFTVHFNESLFAAPLLSQNFGQVDIVSKDPRTVVLMLDSPEPLVQAKACEALLKYMQQCELELDVWLQHTHTQESAVSRPSCSHIRVS